MAEDELQGRLEPEETFLVLHDQVVGPLGVIPVGLVVFLGIRPRPLLVDGEVALVGVGRQEVGVLILQQGCVFRQLDGPSVFGLEQLGVFALDGHAIRDLLAVFVHVVDEEEAQHLDPHGVQAQFLVQVLLDGPADHLLLDGLGGHAADGLPDLQPPLGSGGSDLHQLLALCGADLAHQAVVVHGPARHLLQVIPVLNPLGFPNNGLALLHIQFGNGPYGALLGVDFLDTNVGGVVVPFYHAGGDFDLLHQLALIGIDGIQAVDHVVLVGMGG